jgi:hypothetical protein
MFCYGFRCGREYLPCESVEYGNTHLIPSGESRLRVIESSVVKSPFTISDVSLASHSESELAYITFSGLDSEGYYINAKNLNIGYINFILPQFLKLDGLFNVEGNLVVSNSFFAPLEDNVFVSPVLFISSSASISNSKFSNIKAPTNGSALVGKIPSEKTLEIISTTFENIGVDYGHGGSVYVILDNKASLLIKDSVFKSFVGVEENQKGYGGAVYIAVSGKEDYKGSVTFTGNNIFEGSTATYGKYIFVAAQSVGTVVNSYSFNYVQLSDDLQDLYNLMGSDYCHTVVPLNLYLGLFFFFLFPHIFFL